MFTTYQQALEYLYSNLPMFQRVGAVAYKKDLSNTIALCHALDNPQKSFQSIHIAGTNGKGSTSHMLASVLQSSGYKTGLYTSPHLKSFTERIKVDGQEIDKDFVLDFVNRIKHEIDMIQPSFFEITVAMAFEYFKQKKVDIAVIEVGLGGRLDSTNIITPIVSVITNIGNDHKDLLGDTLEKIASEKAGIIKPRVPVVISEYQSDLKHVFESKAQFEAAPIYFASQKYKVKEGSKGLQVFANDHLYINELYLPLKGNYQFKNLPGVLRTVDLLREAGFTISEELLRKGLENTVKQTSLKGRWQKLNDQPLIICDTGHNEDGVRELIKQIHQQHYKKLHMIWGMVKDKDVTNILSQLPVEASYYFCQANIPRAMDAHTLLELSKAFNLKGEVIKSVNEAIQKAKTLASPDDFIFIGGSTFVVAEIENL